jgi:hypothetical protein
MKKLFLLMLLPVVISCGGSSEDEGLVSGADGVIVETLANQEVEAFFGVELNFLAGTKHFFPETHESLCYMVNSREELENLYSGQQKLPDIDFSKHTLIIGQQRMPSTPYNVRSIQLRKTGSKYVLLLEVERSEWVAGAFYDMGYWKLFQKVDKGPLEVKVTEIAK